MKLNCIEIDIREVRGGIDGVATCYGPDSPTIELWRRKNFPSPCPLRASLKSRPVSCTIDTTFFPGSKATGRWYQHPSPLTTSTGVKSKQNYNSASFICFIGTLCGNITPNGSYANFWGDSLLLTQSRLNRYRYLVNNATYF